MKSGYSFRCALLYAALFIAIKLSVFFTHAQFISIGAYAPLIALTLIVIPLYFGIKNKRDQELNGFISLREVMKTGFFISFISSLLISVFIFIYYQYIDREIVTHWIAEAQRLGVKENKSADEIKTAIETLTRFYSPFNQVTGVLTGVLGVGIVLSFILSSFLVRRSAAEIN